MTPEKSPVRVEIERQILTALAESDRPMTLRELMPAVDAAEGPQQVARILGYMRNDGQVANGPDVQPGEPGGLSGKGARSVASYQLKGGPAILQGKISDIDLIAALKMIAAEDDDGEACLDNRRTAALKTAYPEVVETFDRLDDAADSHNGDEFKLGIIDRSFLDPERAIGECEEVGNCIHDDAGWISDEDHTFERDVLELREIAEQAALGAADALIRGSHLRAWEAVQRLHRAVTTFASDYV